MVLNTIIKTIIIELASVWIAYEQERELLRFTALSLLLAFTIGIVGYLFIDTLIAHYREELRTKRERKKISFKKAHGKY